MPEITYFSPCKEKIMLESQMKNLKLNYHMLEYCNYRCKFCFARYARKEHLAYSEMHSLIMKIAQSGIFSAINFAGGEPFLIDELPELVRYAKRQGLETSVITNGLLLTEEKLRQLLPYLDCIGMSFHSMDDDTKRKVGFCGSGGLVLSNEKLTEIIGFIENNSKCQIKINTVVNAFNKEEILMPFIQDLQIDRWKILRCQPFGNNDEMLISDDDWNSFCERNKGVAHTVFESTMEDTYIMVNPQGMLLKEAENGKSYVEIGSFLECDVKELLFKHPLRMEKYTNRYS